MSDRIGIEPTGGWGMAERADLLLLNASNYPGLPIFPYAFVQVSAVARRHGLTVRRLDLLGVPRAEWPERLAAVLAEVRPRMVGTHLRQADSLYIWDYAEPGKPGLPASAGRDYFPVEDTRYLVDTVRTLTTAPVVIGGFGFTTHARRLVDLLRPDFGIQGEPDDFFAKFDRVLAGDGLGDVDNLIHRGETGYTYGKRVFHGPAPHREYDEEILAELVDFYGSPGIFAPGGPHVAVEVVRGCPYRCYFCTEPMVKGKQRHQRDLDVVLAEVEFLAGHGVPRVWLICSEINAGSNDLLLELGERFARFNRARPAGRRMAWSAYFLPNPPLERAEMRDLLDAGFEPGWNQFMSFDDENLKRTKVPYRRRHALRAQVDWAVEMRAHAIREGRSTRGHRLDMFLGNSFADARTVTETLAAVNEARLSDYHDSALITRATRVFDLGQGRMGDAAEDAIFSIGPDGVLPEPDLLYPTFHYPEDLVARLGGPQAVDELFEYLEDTFFSRAHESKKDWLGFLRAAVRPADLAQWCAGRADALAAFELKSADEGFAREVARLAADACGPDGPGVVADLLSARGTSAKVRGATAYVLAELVLASWPREIDALVHDLGLVRTDSGELKGSEYEILRVLHQRFDSEAELFAHVERELGVRSGTPAHFALRYYLYRYNLKLRPEYRDVLFHGLPGRARRTMATEPGTGYDPAAERVG